MAATETSSIETREQWLIRAVDALRPLFAEIGETVPAVRVSVGFPGGGSARKRIGECWVSSSAKDGVSQLFVSPIIGSGVQALDVLTHELIHAIDDCQSGHKGRFSKMAKAVGLAGKMTATHAGPELEEKLKKIVEDLGAYPHAALSLNAAGTKKQSTRMLKVECPEGSGYIVRMTRKWLDEFGAPSCPCHGAQMNEAA